MKKRKKLKYHLFGSGWNIVDRIFDINGVLLYRLVQAIIIVGIINSIDFLNPTVEILVALGYVLLISFTFLVIIEGASNNFFYVYTREKYFGHFIRDWFKDGFAKAKIRFDDGMSWARLLNNNPDLEYKLDRLNMDFRTRTIKTIVFQRKRCELLVEYGVYNKDLDGYHVLWCQDPKWKEKRDYYKSIAHEGAMLNYPDDHAYDADDERFRKLDEMIYKAYGQEGLDACTLTGKDLQKKEAELNARKRLEN